jgi:hypothetical protein
LKATFPCQAPPLGAVKNLRKIIYPKLKFEVFMEIVDVVKVVSNSLSGRQLFDFRVLSLRNSSLL